MSSRTDEFRRRAQQCLTLTRRVKSKQERASLLEMARVWSRLATLQEGARPRGKPAHLMVANLPDGGDFAFHPIFIAGRCSNSSTLIFRGTQLVWSSGMADFRRGVGSALAFRRPHHDVRGRCQGLGSPGALAWRSIAPLDSLRYVSAGHPTPGGLKNSFFGRARVSGGLLLLGRCLTCDQLQRAPRSSPGHPC